MIQINVPTWVTDAVILATILRVVAMMEGTVVLNFQNVHSHAIGFQGVNVMKPGRNTAKEKNR